MDGTFQWSRFARIALLLLVCIVVGVFQTHSPDRRSATQTDGATASDLPPEARGTLALIHAGGPFPYEKDGVVFGNYEHRLPEQPHGYYHEYTVPTPGERNRGTRRIIAGGGNYWYTDDHYETFRPVRE